MLDTELYKQILGITDPWFVENVDLKFEKETVDVFLSHKRKIKWPCPECGKMLSCRDHADERVWRHLDTCQLQTLLRARIPRVDCPEHGVKQVKVPWAEPKSRFTLLMERFAIKVILKCATIKGAKEILRTSWDETWGIMNRAVKRGLVRKEQVPVHYLGIDEKAFKKGHKYMTIVSDAVNGNVQFVGETREAGVLREYYEGLNKEQLEGIRAVAMDMWPAYISATLHCVPNASEKIVFDKFHVASHLSKAVDQVRRQEHRELKAKEDKTLNKTRYLWLYNEDNLPDKHKPAFEELKKMDLKVAKAWAMKEDFRHFWEYLSPYHAGKFLKKWCNWAKRSGLAPMKKVAETILNHKGNLITYAKHRLTNAVAEGLNSRIMAIKRMACGFRNTEHFKTAIYFHCGGLDLDPR